jgi:hypothetical protein
MQKWEYQTRIGRIDEEIGEFPGVDGWELVAVVKQKDDSWYAFFYFKRPLNS